MCMKVRYMANLNKLFATLKTLNKEDLEALSSRVLSLLGVSLHEEAESLHLTNCRNCNSTRIVKIGKDKNGRQRYRCKDCGTTFGESTFTVVSRTRYSAETWQKFIVLTLQGVSLADCAAECGFSVQTAFSWRHKVLHALEMDQNDRMLGGVVEADETFFNISYKGNHKKSTGFEMPREAYKRGTDNKSQTGSRACVMCALERNGQAYAEVLGKGQPTAAKVAYAFGERIMPETILISDGASGMEVYCRDFAPSFELVQMKAHKNPKDQRSPPEIRGAFHIQNINNMHTRIRRFLRPYNGVATKYLNHYVSLFIWLENRKKMTKGTLTEELNHSLNTEHSYITLSDIVKKPPVPIVA